jgi:hypothetical protein
VSEKILPCQGDGGGSFRLINPLGVDFPLSAPDLTGQLLDGYALRRPKPPFVFPPIHHSNGMCPRTGLGRGDARSVLVPTHLHLLTVFVDFPTGEQR